MTWTVDPTHTEITFSAKHMMVSTVRGRFTSYDVDVDIDTEHPERSRVTATIDVASLTTGHEDRDAHLRSADFFDVERHPHLTFVSKRVERAGDDRFRLVGDLTIRDVTREVTLTGEFAGPVTALSGGRAVGFSVTGEVNREDFGLTWNMALERGGVLVGKTVKLAIDTEVVEAAAGAEEQARVA